MIVIHTGFAPMGQLGIAGGKRGTVVGYGAFALNVKPIFQLEIVAGLMKSLFRFCNVTR
jgi:hypothetical protein